MIALDDYRALHSRPCRKHGYMICGYCYYYGPCKHEECKCTKYHSAIGQGGICLECNHARISHRLCPFNTLESHDVSCFRCPCIILCILRCDDYVDIGNDSSHEISTRL